MTITPYASSYILQFPQDGSSEQKDIEYNETIDRIINELILQLSDPEIGWENRHMSLYEKDSSGKSIKAKAYRSEILEDRKFKMIDVYKQFLRNLNAHENRLYNNNAPLPSSVKPSVFPVNTYDIPYKTDVLYKEKLQKFFLTNIHTASSIIKKIPKKPPQIQKMSMKKWEQMLVHDDAFKIFDKAISELINNSNKKIASAYFTEALKLFLESREMGKAEKDMFAENIYCCGYIYYHFKFYLKAATHLQLAAQLNPSNQTYDDMRKYVLIQMFNMDPIERIEWIDKALAEPNTSSFSNFDLWLCKLEAHLLLGESDKFMKAAKSILDRIAKTHPESHRLLEFHMANPQFLST